MKLKPTLMALSVIIIMIITSFIEVANLPLIIWIVIVLGSLGTLVYMFMGLYEIFSKMDKGD